MNTINLNRFTAIVLGSLLFQSVFGAEPSIRVLVHGEHQGPNVVYHYTVINNGSRPFNNITIGSEYDAEKKRTWPELGKLPLGWRYGREGELGPQILLNEASTTQPSGWRARVFGAQDIDYFYLRWFVPFESSSRGIEPGQTVSGFSVTVPRGEDPELPFMSSASQKAYLNGHFTIGFTPGPDFHGSIERRDTTPPTLNLSVVPSSLWPPNGKLMPVNVTMSVKDDYDPAPEVKLESITANEPLGEGDIAEAALGSDDRQFKLAAKRGGGNKEGRVYTITYSATDGSGNKATATATVLVPHDQRQ